MQQVSVERSDSDGFNVALQSAVSEISRSADLNGACIVFAAFLENLDAQLLSVKFCDINDRSSNLRPYSAYHKAMHQFRSGPGYPDGCPFSREAMKRLRPFSLQSIDRREYGNLEDRRFFKELENIGHQDIAVLPIVIGRGLALMTVGLGDETFVGSKRSLISDTAPHFVAAIVARFPDVSRLFETKVLSEVQRQVVLLACEGRTDEEIAQQLQLSAVAIGLIFAAAAKRLRTKTRAATVYRAVVLGEVPSGSHLSDGFLFHKETSR